MTTLKRGGFQWRNWDLKSGYKPVRWRSTVIAPSCGCCNKPVYPAEEVMGAGQKFHKLCLKCGKVFVFVQWRLIRKFSFVSFM